MSQAAAPRVVQLEVRLEAPPSRVFRYLVEPSRYVRWQGVRAELDPRPGGVFRVEMETGDVARGTYLEVDPPRRVVLTWGFEGNASIPPGSTTVEFALRADGDGTLLTLRHSGLPDEAVAAMHEEGWRQFTARLATAAAERPVTAGRALGVSLLALLAVALVVATWRLDFNAGDPAWHLAVPLGAVVAGGLTAVVGRGPASAWPRVVRTVGVAVGLIAAFTAVVFTFLILGLCGLYWTRTSC